MIMRFNNYSKKLLVKHYYITNKPQDYLNIHGTLLLRVFKKYSKKQIIRV